VKRTRLRSGLLTVILISCVAVAWWYLAPPRVGGSTTYVATHGISMEPRFHTGDLAIVRPVASYKVGDVVAYHSNLLHTVVLHRIIGRQGNLYIFKGDNNDFVDPRPVPRSDLIGKLWLHIPHGGVLLQMLHTPIGAAALCAIVGLFAFVGTTETKRRRRRRRTGATGSSGKGSLDVKPASDHTFLRPVNFRVLLIVSGVAAVAFLALGMFAFTRSTQKTSAVTTPYSQQVQFAYSAHAQAGPVYPTGHISTGDPIFLSLVHRIRIHIAYTFATTAGHQVSGTEGVDLTLAGNSGWTRSLTLVPPTHFQGDHTSTDVTLDLPQLESLLAKVGSLTGLSGDAGYTIAVAPRVQVAGTVAGHPVNTRFDPALSFTLGPAQLTSNGASSAPSTSSSSAPAGSAGSSQLSLTPSQSGSVATVTRQANPLGFLGVSLNVSIVRWLALLGFVISSALALLAFLRRTAEPFQETAHIQSQYGHMIVPIVAGEDLGWPAVDVPTIKALVRLAESGARLILHSRANEIDTYMVNDEGTVYRYQVRPSKVIWGEWSEAAAPVRAAA
jgi:signal peptidase I